MEDEDRWDLHVYVTRQELEVIAKTGRIPDNVRYDIEFVAREALKDEAQKAKRA